MKSSNYTPFMGKRAKFVSASFRHPGKWTRSHKPSCTAKEALKFEDEKWRESRERRKAA